MVPEEGADEEGARGRDVGEVVGVSVGAGDEGRASVGEAVG